MKPAVAWICGVAMIVAAGFVAAATPDGEQRITDAFRTPTTVGRLTESDGLAVRVNDLQLADGLSYGGWRAEGTWLVVALDAWVTRTETGGVLGRAYLTVGERTYLASERPRSYAQAATIDGFGLHVGTPRSGELVFELPAEVTAAPGADHAVLQLSSGTALPGLSPTENQQGAAVIELTVDLTTLPRVDDHALTGATWGTP